MAIISGSHPGDRGSIPRWEIFFRRLRCSKTLTDDFENTFRTFYKSTSTETSARLRFRETKKVRIVRPDFITFKFSMYRLTFIHIFDTSCITSIFSKTLITDIFTTFKNNLYSYILSWYTSISCPHIYILPTNSTTNFHLHYSPKISLRKYLVSKHFYHRDRTHLP